MSDYNSYIKKLYKTSANEWYHVEGYIDIMYHDMPISFMFEDFGKNVTSNQDCLIDNLIMASAHGPKEYNIGVHSHLYPCFMVLSFDYDLYDG